MLLPLLLLFALWATPTFAQWANEPSGATRVLNCPMSAADCVGGVVRGTWLDVYHNLTYFDPGNAPLSPLIVARASLIYPNTTGGGELGWWDNQADRGLYMGVYFRFTAGGSSIPGFTKLFFLRNNANLAEGSRTNGVFLIGGRDAVTRQLVFGINTGGLNNSHVCGGGGELCYPNVSSGNFTIGQWVKLEAIVCASTTTTAQNGTARWWINGVEAGRYTNLNYGSGSTNEFWWNQTWDGEAGLNGKGFTGDVHQDVDHLVVSAIPASACNTTTTIDNPAGAPGLVSGFTATVGGVQ